MTVNCLVCHNKFKTVLSKIKIGKGKYCSNEYTLWRIAVFMRDDYTCQMCNVRGGTLNADHIKPFALFPELRLAIDNGRTLCIDCHKQTDTYAGRVHNYFERKVS